MADIKNLSIFGGSNRGLDKIKRASDQKKEDTPPIPEENVKKEEAFLQKNPLPKSHGAPSHGGVRRVGAPVRHHDQVYTTKMPLKLSAVTVSLTKILSEKYMAKRTRDEILRLALDEYIRHHLTKEDKEALLWDLEKDLSAFREKYPTHPSYNEQGDLFCSPKEIEEQTLETFMEQWGILKSTD